MRVTVQSTFEGRQFKVEQAQRLVRVAHRLAEDPHRVEPYRCARRGKSRGSLGMKTVILDLQAG
jgi:hypothetical protein